MDEAHESDNNDMQNGLSIEEQERTRPNIHQRHISQEYHGTSSSIVMSAAGQAVPVNWNQFNVQSEEMDDFQI